MNDPDVTWRLIAVLQSTVFLPAALSARLYRAAVELHRSEAEIEPLAEEIAVGYVRRLGRELLLGTFGGPGFEASIDTPDGKGFVRFIVTQEGIDYAETERSRRREHERQTWN